MRKEGQAPTPKQEYKAAVSEPAVSKKPAEHYGTKVAVKLVPKFREYTAMYFEDFESLMYIIPWLGKAFYALTDGDPISIDRNLIRANNKTTEDAPMSHLMLIILDPVSNNLLVVQAGHWIMYNELDGYSVFTNDEIRDRYDFVDKK